MKALIKISVLAATLAAFAIPSTYAADAAPAPAPAAKHPGMGPLQRRAAIRRQVLHRLKLSEDQKAQLKAGQAKTRDAVKAVRADTSLTPEQKKAKVRETLQTARAEMRSVLTPDQQAKLDRIRQHLRKGKAAGVN